MSAKALYALTVLVAVGVLSYLLRALPFVLFGRRGEPPAVVRYVGRVLSPAAIAMLSVYCCAGETAGSWTAVALAGTVTVALQVWRRNPLLSILAGTALYMALVH